MRTPPPNPWLTFPQPNPQARLRLFCFPYAGGNAMMYRGWPAGLSAAVEVVAIQLPGHGNRLQEPLFNRLGPLVSALAPHLTPHLDKPFAFMGHSMGALIAFELARLLRREGRPGPAHLFVSGRSAPQLKDVEARTYDLPEAEFVEELRRLNGTPKEVLEHPELITLMTPILRADFAVCQTYQYASEPPLDCPITAFGGLQDTEVPREHLEAWRAQTAGPFSLRMLPGDHFFLNTARAVLTQAISAELRRLL